MGKRPYYCPCYEETPDPCPACGATVEGNDPVGGVCQSVTNRCKPEPLVRLVLVHRDTGEVI